MLPTLNRLGKKVALPALLAAAALALLAFGCGNDGGGDGQEPPSSAASNGAAPAEGPEPGGQGSILVAALGDSITAGNPGWDPDPAYRGYGPSEADARSQYEYWAEREHPQLEFRNCGVAGERTDEIAARLDDCAEGAEALVVQGGVNDIAGAVGGPPGIGEEVVEQAASNLEAMVQRGQELGLRVALANVGPWNNGYEYGADRLIRALNARIAAIGRSEGVPVLPWYATLSDPARPGRTKSAWTAEGDHPSVLGYRRLGEIAFRLPR